MSVTRAATAPGSSAASLVIARVADTAPPVALASLVTGSAAIWLEYEKGVVNGDTLLFAARDAGLKDSKVARIGERYAALSFTRRS